MEYLNFEIKIGTPNNGEYPISIINSPSGRLNYRIHLPFSSQLFLEKLIAFENTKSNKKTRNIPPKKSAERDIDFILDPNKDAKIIQSLGIELFENLFKSRLLGCFISSLQKAKEEKKGLRILFRFETPEIAQLPWEYLFDPHENDYINLSTKTPIIRFIEQATPIDCLTIKPPLKILGVAANPQDLSTINVEEEKTLMYNAIEHLIEKGIIEIEWLKDQSWRALQSKMRKDEWHILHFIGHGAFDPINGEGGIAMTDDDQNSFLLTTTNLARLLGDHTSIRLVVLNSCEGAKGDDKDIFSSTGAMLVKKGIPAVISMQDKITDQAAFEFSRVFYQIITENGTIDLALQEARKAMSIALGNSFEWGLPVLHIHSTNSKFFHIDIASAIFDEKIHNNLANPILQKKEQKEYNYFSNNSKNFRDCWDFRN